MRSIWPPRRCRHTCKRHAKLSMTHIPLWGLPVCNCCLEVTDCLGVVFIHSVLQIAPKVKIWGKGEWVEGRGCKSGECGTYSVLHLLISRSSNRCQIVRENANFRGSETDSAERERKQISTGKRNRGKGRGTKRGSTGFSSAPNTRETYWARSHAAIARLNRLKTAAGCHSRGQALGMNVVIPTRFWAMFRLRKSECFESFEVKDSPWRSLEL